MLYTGTFIKIFRVLSILSRSFCLVYRVYSVSSILSLIPPTRRLSCAERSVAEMPKFFGLKSKSKSKTDDFVGIEGESLPPSPKNDADVKKAVGEGGIEGEGLQLSGMDSKEGKRGEETESKGDVVDEDDSVIYPGKVEVGIITLALILAVFMVALVGSCASY